MIEKEPFEVDHGRCLRLSTELQPIAQLTHDLHIVLQCQVLFLDTQARYIYISHISYNGIISILISSVVIIITTSTTIRCCRGLRSHPLHMGMNLVSHTVYRTLANGMDGLFVLTKEPMGEMGRFLEVGCHGNCCVVVFWFFWIGENGANLSIFDFYMTEKLHKSVKEIGKVCEYNVSVGMILTR